MDSQPARPQHQLLRSPEELQGFAHDLANTPPEPLAVDTERASGIHYDDRAFLIQVNSDELGTQLIDPDAHRDQVGEILSPEFNKREWVLHDATGDLPCLAWLGLYPAKLFDTQLAAALAGQSKLSLIGLTEDLLGIEISKNHQAENWSVRPIPESWLRYAAADVDNLLDIAGILEEILDSQGRLEWLEQECEHRRLMFADIDAPAPRSLEQAKGYARIRHGKQRAVFKAIWEDREEEARGRDVAPTRILSDRVLAQVAEATPKTYREFEKIVKPARRRPGRNVAVPNMAQVRRWWEAIERAYKAGSRSWPKPVAVDYGSGTYPPKNRNWQQDDPESYEAFQAVSERRNELAQDLGIDPALILGTKPLAMLVWRLSQGEGGLEELMDGRDMRPWQKDLMRPILAEEF